MLTSYWSDVGVFAEVDDIMEALKETWGIPLGHKCKVLAVTVPRATIDEQYPQLVTRRNDLNQKIKDFNADGLYVSPIVAPQTPERR